jgi:hypothetical protein
MAAPCEVPFNKSSYNWYQYFILSLMNYMFMAFIIATNYISKKHVAPTFNISNIPSFLLITSTEHFIELFLIFSSVIIALCIIFTTISILFGSIKVHQATVDTLSIIGATPAYIRRIFFKHMFSILLKSIFISIVLMSATFVFLDMAGHSLGDFL